MKNIFFILVVVIALFAVSSFALETEDEAFPPVIYTYNPTKCAKCEKRCFVKFDRSHLADRQTCSNTCKAKPYCSHFQPVQYKPEKIKPVRLTLLQRANFTGRLPPLPQKEYVGAEVRGDSPQEFFAKLQKYVNWREAQRVEAEEPSYNTPDTKNDNDVELEGLSHIGLGGIIRSPEYVTPSFADSERRRRRFKGLPQKEVEVIDVQLPTTNPDVGDLNLL